MQLRICKFVLCCAIPFLAGLPGCGRSDLPQIGLVDGRVTMGEQPLAGLIVTFKPEKGRPAMGITDQDGHFDLEYTYGVKGTKVGANTVGFSWPIGTTGQPEIPARYSGKSELFREVKSGRNTFDFELEANAPSLQKKRQKPVSPE
ncbi:MAG: hypothetical protein U0929_05810 [Planctomycetaceae bacterium]